MWLDVWTNKKRTVSHHEDLTPLDPTSDDDRLDPHIHIGLPVVPRVNSLLHYSLHIACFHLNNRQPLYTCLRSKEAVMVSFAYVLVSFVSLAISALAIPADTKPECKAWAESGECDENPDFMNVNCASSCSEAAKIAEASAEKIAGINSFFDLRAELIDGQMKDFSDFEGGVTVITNVASECVSRTIDRITPSCYRLPFLFDLTFLPPVGIVTGLH